MSDNFERQTLPAQGASAERNLNASLANQDDVDFGDDSVEAFGRRKPPHKPGRPHLPSRDTVQKLIDSVGIAAAAAQLGVDIATLQGYMNGN